MTGYPTTRRHPRTLAEAFPDVRAPAIERPARRQHSAAEVLAAAFVLVLAVLCLGAL